MASIWISMGNVCGNVSLCLTLVRAIRVYDCSYLHDYTGWRLHIWRSGSSKDIVGLNSKLVHYAWFCRGMSQFFPTFKEK